MNITMSQNKNDAWYWELMAGNGETLAISESYSSKSKCLKTVKSVAKTLGFVQLKNVELVWELIENG
jgi:uncharacterized protein YegP (UPF0339 family)